MVRVPPRPTPVANHSSNSMRGSFGISTPRGSSADLVYELEDVTLFADVYFTKTQFADIALTFGQAHSSSLELFFDNCSIRVDIIEITDDGVAGRITSCSGTY